MCINAFARDCNLLSEFVVFHKISSNYLNLWYCAEFVRYGAEFVWYCAEFVRYGAEFVRYGAEFVRYGAEFVRYRVNWV